MRHKPLPPLEQVEALLEICKNSPSGLKWKVKRKNRNPGDVAGTCRPSGHWQVKINNVHYGVHRIIFLLQNKYDPKDSVVDHRFGTEKPLELRAASRAENRWNSKKQKNGKSKYKGVYWHKRDKYWGAAIMKEGKRIYASPSKTEIEAALKYNKLALEFHKEFAVLNKIYED